MPGRTFFIVQTRVWEQYLVAPLGCYWAGGDLNRCFGGIGGCRSTDSQWIAAGVPRRPLAHQCERSLSYKVLCNSFFWGAPGLRKAQVAIWWYWGMVLSEFSSFDHEIVTPSLVRRWEAFPL